MSALLNQKVMIIWLACLYFAVQTVEADVYIYPDKGQSKAQQDQGHCSNWAKQQSGFDPAAPPRATAPPPAAAEAPEGGLLRGGARGALGGLVIGAIAGDAGKGAAIGAAAGGLLGGMRRRDQVRREGYAQDQWASQQAANYQQNRANYNRALARAWKAGGIR